MLRNLLDLLLHRYIRSGDLLCLYKSDGTPCGQYRVRIEGFGLGACVRLVGGDPDAGIRRDLPRWNGWFGRWTYRYED